MAAPSGVGKNDAKMIVQQAFGNSPPGSGAFFSSSGFPALLANDANTMTIMHGYSLAAGASTTSTIGSTVYETAYVKGPGGTLHPTYNVANGSHFVDSMSCAGVFGPLGSHGSYFPTTSTLSSTDSRTFGDIQSALRVGDRSDHFTPAAYANKKISEVAFGVIQKNTDRGYTASVINTHSTSIVASDRMMAAVVRDPIPINGRQMVAPQRITTELLL